MGGGDATAKRTTPATVRSNAEWIALLAEDGPRGTAAQSELRALLVAGLRRVLASRGVDADTCEDFAQDAIVRVRERLADFRGESRFTTWALAIATHLAFDELRHKRWEDVSLQDLSKGAHEALQFEPSHGAAQESSLLRRRVVAELCAILEHKLTEKQRIALWALIQGMPHAELAERLGISRNALYKLSHDARKRVRDHLEAAGLAAEDVLSAFE